MTALSSPHWFDNPSSSLDGRCVERYLSVVSVAYCASVRTQSPFVCPKKTKTKRAVAGTIARGYWFVAHPTREQQSILNRILGASRWVWNWGLSLYLEHEKNQATSSKSKLSPNEVSRRLTALKTSVGEKIRDGVVVKEKHWLNSIPDTVLRQSLMDLSNAWKAYESGQNGMRRDKPGKPKFKTKPNDKDCATFQVDARKECKTSCIDIINQTIKIPGIDKTNSAHVLRFAPTEEVLGEISSFVVSKKAGRYFVSLSMINITPEQIWDSKIKAQAEKAERAKKKEIENNGEGLSETCHRENQEKSVPFVEFAFDEYPICSTLNPNKEGLIAIDMATKWGGIATNDGKTTHQLISPEQRARISQKEHNTVRFQRVQTRKIEAKYAEYGIERDATGAWPKDAGKLLAEKVKQRNERHKEKRQLEISSHPSLTALEKQQQIASLKDIFFVKSKRQIRVEQKLAKTHAGKRNDLVDAIHKVTTTIVRQNHTIVLETLNIKAMLEDDEKHSGFKKSVANTCWGEIKRQLLYKAKWYGRNVLFTSPWFASSQLCSTQGCTYQHKALKLSDTHWTCPMCNIRHERNSNASFNLWLQGWQLLEEFFQQNSTKNLADGSFVKGSQGVYEKSISVGEHRALKKATSGKPHKKRLSATVQRFVKTA